MFQFRYKRRVYTQTHLDEKQLSKLHTKVRPHTVHADVLLWNNTCSMKVFISTLLKRVSRCRFNELSLVIPDDTNQICQFQVTSQKQTAVHQNDDPKHTFLHGFIIEEFVIVTVGIIFCYLQDGSYAIGNRLDAWG